MKGNDQTMKKHYTRRMQSRRMRRFEKEKDLIHIATIYTKVLGRPYRGRNIMKAKIRTTRYDIKKWNKKWEEEKEMRKDERFNILR